MVRPADKYGATASQGAFGGILKALSNFPGRGELTLRLTLICVLTALLAETYGTPEVALSIYIIFFLIRPDRVTTALMSAVLFTIVTLLIGTILLLTMTAIDYPAIRVAEMALLSFCILYLASASKLRPIGGIAAMIVGYGLDFMGRISIGELSTRALLYLWLLVAIPVGVTIIISLMIAPSPRRLAGRDIASRLRLSAQRLCGEPDANDAFQGVLLEGNKQILTWVKLSALEGTTSREDAAAFNQAAAASIAVLNAVDVLGDESQRAHLPEKQMEQISQMMNRMAEMFDQGGYPVDIELNFLPALAGASLASRAALEDLKISLAQFTTPAKPTAVPEPPPRKEGFIRADAASNPEHIAYALKTTIAAVFCYLMYMLLDWPGIHTCVITCYVVSLGTTAETVQKLNLRIVGCLIGSALGIVALVFVVPHLESIVGFLLMLGLVISVSAWIALGPKSISYMGFQIAFAFLLCTVQGSGPEFDLTLARDRTIGILLGNFVTFLLFTYVWPVSIGERVDQALKAMRKQWRAVVEDGAERHSQVGDALAALKNVEESLALVSTEPKGIRPTEDWQRSRQGIVLALSAAISPMILAARLTPGAPELLARLDRAEHRNAPAKEQQTQARDPQLQGLLDFMDERMSRISMSPTARTQQNSEDSSAHAST